jgi:hypothetical protein
MVLAPAPYLLIRRGTDGVYRDLSNAFARAKGENPFRVAFGHVFQEYVGRLLRACCAEEQVLPEWSYKPVGKNERATPDWIVADGNRLVVIEVKQTALAVGAKSTGNSDLVMKDLQKTLAKGATQLLRFEGDLADRAPGLERLFAMGVPQMELLLVTYDRVPFANSFLRKEITRSGIENAERVHICHIEEFEHLQRLSLGKSLYRLLRRKRLAPEHAVLDFREWLGHLGAPAPTLHPLLSDVFERLMTDWGIRKTQVG